jgi:hypothetical protein
MMISTELRRRITCAVVVLLSFLAYLATLAPGLTWAHNGADGGDLAAAVLTGGVPHPPGYPTYMLLGRLFAMLPVGDVAFRLNLFSAVCAALTAGVVFLWLHRWAAPSLGDAVPAAAALTLAFSPLLWSQAIITEVYTLNALFVAVLLWLATARPVNLVLLCFMLGLGLGNHLSLALLAPTLAVLADGALPAWRRRAVPCLAALAAGLGVYLYLPLAAISDPAVNWGDVRTFDGLVWMVTAAPYRSYLFGLPLAELPARLSAWSAMLAQQFTWPGVGLLLLGMWDMAATHRRRTLALAVGFALYSLYSLSYRTDDSFVNLLPAYLLATPWLARGLQRAVQAVHSWLGRYGVADRRRWGLAVAVLALLPLWQVQANWSSLDLSGDAAARDYVESVLGDLPPAALVITASDEQTFALWYGTAARRHGALIVDRDLTQFSWYRRQIERRAPDLQDAPDSDVPLEYVAALIEAARDERPVFLADDDAALQARFTWRKEGALWHLE